MQIFTSSFFSFIGCKLFLVIPKQKACAYILPFPNAIGNTHPPYLWNRRRRERKEGRWKQSGGGGGSVGGNERVREGEGTNVVSYLRVSSYGPLILIYWNVP